MTHHQICKKLSCLPSVKRSPTQAPISQVSGPNPSFRATVGTYQQWANAVGDSSYNFVTFLPYFEKSCAFTGPNYSKRSQSGSANIGTVSYDPLAFILGSGPLQVSYQNYVAPITTAIQKAFQGAGLKLINGFNSGSLIGYAEVTATIDPKTAIRSSSESSFLQKAISSSSIQLYNRTIAKKINFDSSGTATGVNVNTNDVSYTLTARKEVILAAGAVGFYTVPFRFHSWKLFCFVVCFRRKFIV